MSDAALVAASAVGAASITGLTSLGVVAYQSPRRERAAARRDLARSYVDSLARSMGIGFRARMLGEMMKVRSGLAEGLDVATRLRKPVDLMELYDWQAQDWDALNDAWASFWTRCRRHDEN